MDTRKRRASKRRPQPQLDANSDRLLKLLDQLLSSMEPEQSRGNQASSTIVLSDKEASELGRLFATLLQSKDFVQALFFVDQIYGQPHSDLKNLKAIFVEATKRKGRSINIQSTMKWREFLVRLGMERPVWPHQNVRPMSFDQFLEMEKRLLDHLGLEVKTREIMLQVASAGRIQHERRTAFDFTDIKGERLDRTHEPQEPLYRLVKQRVRRTFEDAISRDPSAQQLAGLATLIANSTIMFTTRDWGVAGTISTMCGAVPLMVIKDRA